MLWTFYANFFLSKETIVCLTNVALALAAVLNFSPEFTQCTAIQLELDLACKWYSIDAHLWIWGHGQNFAHAYG